MNTSEWPVTVAINARGRMHNFACDWFSRKCAVFMSHFAQQIMLFYLVVQQLTIVAYSEVRL